MEQNRANGKSTLESIEAKIDSLAGNVKAVETRLTGVETRLTGVEAHVEDMARQLVKVQVTGNETKQFARDSWDSLQSLARNMEEGFKAAKKDRDEQTDLVTSAVRRWGERVEQLERQRRATKRRT